MPFLAAIGGALTAGVATGTAATIIGTAAVASAGLGIASGVKGLTTKAASPSGGNVTPAPTAPTTKQATQAAQAQQRDQQRRATSRKVTSLEEQQNLLSNPSTTKKTLLGQGG